MSGLLSDPHSCSGSVENYPEAFIIFAGVSSTHTVSTALIRMSCKAKCYCSIKQVFLLSLCKASGTGIRLLNATVQLCPKFFSGYSFFKGICLSLIIFKQIEITVYRMYCGCVIRLEMNHMKVQSWVFLCRLQLNTRYLKNIPLLPSNGLSSMHAKLHTVAASNDRDHMPWSLLLLVIAIPIWMLFFAHIPFMVNCASMPRQLRGCNTSMLIISYWGYIGFQERLNLFFCCTKIDVKHWKVEIRYIHWGFAYT